MSFILDALKKLEQEKAARRNGNINISDEILRGNYRVQGKGKRSLSVTLPVAAMAAVLVVAAVVAGALLWKREDAVQETKELPVQRDVRREAPRYPEPSRPQSAARAPESPPILAATPLPRQMEPELEKRPTRNPVEGSAAVSSGGRFEESYQGALPSAGSDLKVSGIAWQEARSARRAVVNGVLISEGTQVGGATVKEIFQNRVRFLSNGRSFDISISGLMPGNSVQSAPARQPNRSDRQSLELSGNH